MAKKNTTPALADLLDAQTLSNMKRDMQKMTNKTYQPILDILSDQLKLKHTTAQVDSVAELELVVKNGQPTVVNNFSLGIAFSPEHTDDVFEQANRLVLTDLFTRTVEKYSA